MILGADGAIRLANGFARAALGHDEPRGATVHDGSGDAAVLAPATTGRAVVRDLDRLVRRDGTAIRVAFAAVPIDLPGGDRGVVVAFTDVVEADDDELRERAPPRRASLRRVAAEIAEEASALRAFATIATEVGRMTALPLLQILRREPDDAMTVLGTAGAPVPGFAAGARCALEDLPGGERLGLSRAPARVADVAQAPGPFAAALRAASIGATVLVPILVEGEIGGAILGGRLTGAPLPDDVEERLAPFGELAATRVASMAARRELTRLADEQAALRRVATLVARDVPAEALFGAVTREVGLLLGVDLANMNRYEADGTAIPIATWALRGNAVPLDLIAPDDGVNLASRVLRTGRVASRSDYGPGTDPITAALQPRGVTTRVGAPIMVEDAIWGVLIVGVTDDARLPHDLGARIAAFTELVATAISNSQARAGRQRLVDDQSALRHIATLVAEGVDEQRLGVEVTATIGRLLGADLAELFRFEDPDALEVVATWAAEGEHPEVAPRWVVTPDDLSWTLRETGRPVRRDDWSTVPSAMGRYIRENFGLVSTVACPIILDGELWGGVSIHRRRDRLPDDTADRISDFTTLIATAMANGRARSDLSHLADEQAALRRVATLVAHEASPDAVFAAVGQELGRLMWSSPTQVVRFDGDDDATVLSGWGDAITPANTKISIAGDNVSSFVRRLAKPVRIAREQWHGPLGEYARSFDLRWGIGAPIVVDGRVWGAMTVVTRNADGFPPGTEERVARFADLVATAISNLEARADLAGSRARLVAAADQERKRVVRDLHDGAQQRLVHTVVTLKLALRVLEAGPGRDLVVEGLAHSEAANDELRDLVHGILPGTLTTGGLRVAIATIARRMAIPVTVDVPAERLPPAIEATAYFVVSEALTNVTKHAQATRVAITGTIDAEHEMLMVSIVDDGRGGARREGQGLLGVADRLAALDGRLQVDSPEGGGTIVSAVVPLRSADR